MQDDPFLIMMNLIDSQYHLRNYFPDLSLLQSLTGLPLNIQEFVEAATRAVFHNDVYFHIFPIQKISVVSDNVVAFDSEKYIDLFDQLFLLFVTHVPKWDPLDRNIFAIFLGFGPQERSRLIFG